MLLRRGSVATILFITYVRIIMYALLCLLKSKSIHWKNWTYARVAVQAIILQVIIIISTYG